MTLLLASKETLLRALGTAIALTIVGSTALARTEADEKTGQYVFKCDSAGKPEAIYECALASTVKAGVISSSIADACRADAASAGARRHQETWDCVKLRQFGAGLPQREWQNATFNDCQRRSQRAGHRYQGKHHQCMVDAYAEQKRASPQRIAECRSETTVHGQMNCLSRDAPATAAAEPAPSPRQRVEAQRAAGGVDPKAERDRLCSEASNAQALANSRKPKQERSPVQDWLHGEFLRTCHVSIEPPDAVWDAAQQRCASKWAAQAAACRAARYVR